MSAEYDQYLDEHICAVIHAASWMLDNLETANELTDVEKGTVLANTAFHDSSKYSEEEYDAYDSYFYGERDEDAFNYAWLHHIHENPHHWQHWLLMNDDGKYRDPDKVVPLEMPVVYVFEMVADWWSFSWRSGNLREMFAWYASNKDNMILHENTRRLVERILEEIGEKIEE